MIDLDKALEAAKSGSLSKADLERVVRRLEVGKNDPDAYRMLHIVGRAGNKREHENLVRGFIESPQDPMLARLALQILGRYWKLLDRYRETIGDFVNGVPWDDEDDARLIAISLAGDYLRDREDCQLISALRKTLLDAELDIGVRRASLDALAIATGTEVGHLPSPLEEVDLDGAWADGVMAKVDARQDCV